MARCVASTGGAGGRSGWRGRARTEQSADPSARTENSPVCRPVLPLRRGGETDDLQLNAPLLQLTGEGGLTGPADRLDYQLLARLQAGQARLICGGTDSVSISGPLAGPRYSADLRPLVERLARLASRPGPLTKGCRSPSSDDGYRDQRISSPLAPIAVTSTYLEARRSPGRS